MTLKPLMVVSPHYDDAVFSCGNLLSALSGCTVVTVCSGLPADSTLVTDWDRRCGFNDAAEAMSHRVRENQNALAALRAEGVDLMFLDSQYVPKTPRNGADLLADSLAATLARLQPSAVLFPLGLFHEDHVLVSDTVLAICPAFPAVRWLAYEDIPYSKNSELTQQRLDALEARGIVTEALVLEGLKDDKAQAVSAYASQLKGLGHKNEETIVRQPERYWKIYRSLDFHSKYDCRKLATQAETRWPSRPPHHCSAHPQPSRRADALPSQARCPARAAAHRGGGQRQYRRHERLRRGRISASAACAVSDQHGCGGT